MINTEVLLETTIQKAWEVYTQEAFIVQWNFASLDWHCPKAENNLKVGGKFIYTMAAKDDSMSFDFSGKYDEIIPQKKITYTMDDNRKAVVLFEDIGNKTKVQVSFEAEQSNPEEMQKAGWQAILNNYKLVAEKV